MDDRGLQPGSPGADPVVPDAARAREGVAVPDPASFTASIQHELRTPTSAIAGYATELVRSLPADSPLALDAGELLEGSGRLNGIVDEFVDVFTRTPVLAPEAVKRFRHDVGSALHVVDGCAELALELCSEGPDGGATELLERILDASHRLRHAVDEVNRSAGEAAELRIETPDESLIEEAVRTLDSLRDPPEVQQANATVLIVDDDDSNRMLLERQLLRFGYEVEQAPDGLVALEVLRCVEVDAILLDIIMPRMNGYEMLAELKSDESTRHIPVVVISAFDDVDSITRCIEMGADDYLPKRFNPSLLNARLRSSLQRKRMRDREKQYLKRIELEQANAERLLLNILPRPAAELLKFGETRIAESFEDVTVMFADLIGFTELASRYPADELVELLNRIFGRFDELVSEAGLEKVKTIGDAYMLVGGLPTPRPDHPLAVARVGLAMLDAVSGITDPDGNPIEMRVGMHSGPVVAGVIGHIKFAYDLWGDTVNVASRMESLGVAGRIQVSATTHERLADHFEFEARGPLTVKGKGELTAYLIRGPAAG